MPSPYTVQYSVRLLQSVLDSSPNAILVLEPAPINHEPAFFIRLANQAAGKLSGQQADTLVNGSFQQFYADFCQSTVFDLIRDTLATKQPNEFEINVRPNPTTAPSAIKTLWYCLTVAPLDELVVLTIEDITAAKALAQQTELLQATLDASLNSIISITAIRDNIPIAGFPNGRIVDFWMNTANEAVIQSLNHTPAQIIGTRMLDTFPGNLESGLFDIYVRVTDTGRPERAIHYYTDEKGLDAWFEVQAVKQGDDGAVLTFMNITEAKRFEQQLQRSNESLKEFAYVASHDLQEPLRKVQSFGDLLATQYGDQLGATGLDMLTRMQSATKRMQLFIRDLLTYSRLSNQPLMLRPLPLNGIIADILSDLEISIDTKQANIEVDSLPTVRGDALQLRQLFQNLLTNALKFVAPGRQPHIRITQQTVDSKTIVPGVAGRFHAIRVADNGIGFDLRHQERIFGAFQRLHSRSQYEGTGIGLAVVKRVVELHKGHIRAEGIPNEGATFTVYLPV